MADILHCFWHLCKNVLHLQYILLGEKGIVKLSNASAISIYVSVQSHSFKNATQCIRSFFIQGTMCQYISVTPRVYSIWRWMQECHFIFTWLILRDSHASILQSPVSSPLSCNDLTWLLFNLSPIVIFLLSQPALQEVTWRRVAAADRTFWHVCAAGVAEEPPH